MTATEFTALPASGNTMTQLLAVIKLEIRKTFLARRGLWVYLLALAPALLYIGHSIYAPRELQRLQKLAKAHPVHQGSFLLIRRGQKRDFVLSLVGEPYWKRVEFRRFDKRDNVERDWYRFTDGKSDLELYFADGSLVRIERDDPDTLADVNVVFATIFQVYYLRLAVFFGCVGIFMNLFRGEMIDKSLHFYLLTPIRREALLAGKFVAGLIAAVVIFTAGTALQLVAMLWEFDHGVVSQYLHAGGWGDVISYLGVTVLACIGYGSLFLAAGLIFTNPIVPAAVVLIWESANLFIPGVLKKISLIYYLQSLCSVPIPPDSSLPRPLAMLISPPIPATAPVAIAAIGIFAFLALVAAAAQVRKLEINYSAD